MDLLVSVLPTEPDSVNALRLIMSLFINEIPVPIVPLRYFNNLLTRLKYTSMHKLRDITNSKTYVRPS